MREGHALNVVLGVDAVHLMFCSSLLVIMLFNFTVCEILSGVWHNRFYKKNLHIETLKGAYKLSSLNVKIHIDIFSPF